MGLLQGIYTAFRFFLIGFRSVISAIALLGVLVPIEWIGGWLQYILSEYRIIVHFLFDWIPLPYRIPEWTERLIAFVFVILGVYLTGPLFYEEWRDDEESTQALGSDDESSLQLKTPLATALTYLFGALVILVPTHFLIELGVVVWGFFANATLGEMASVIAQIETVTFTTIVVSATVAFARKALFWAIGAAFALIVANFLIHRADLLPEPPPIRGIEQHALLDHRSYPNKL